MWSFARMPPSKGDVVFLGESIAGKEPDDVCKRGMVRTWQKVKPLPKLSVIDNVVVGAGAKIIGGFTIGDNSRIGAGSVVVREVPPNSVVVGVPGRITHKDGQRVEGIDLNQTDLPDPVARAIEQLLERIRALEGEVETLRKSVDPDAQLSRDER